MKKIVCVILAALMLLSLAACGIIPGATTPTKPVQSGSNNNNTNTPGLSPVEGAFHPAASGAYATIKIDASVKMDDESAWLGLCPAGKNYITEEEADEVDVIWFGLEAREENDPNVFACDFSEVEDGTYALVVATSDDENVGYIVIQLELTKAGEKLTFNYENAKLNERPAK